MPDAQAVLNRMTASLGALQTFSITSDSTRDEVMALGYKLQNNEHAVLTVRRPDKLRVDLSGDMRDRTFVYDGARLAMYSPDDAAFTRIEAPGTLKELIGGMLDAGIEMPLIDVLGGLKNQVQHVSGNQPFPGPALLRGFSSPASVGVGRS